MLAFADPRREPTSPSGQPSFSQPRKSHQQGKARFWGPSTPEQGSQECGDLGSLTA